MNITKKCSHCGFIFSIDENCHENFCEKCKNTEILKIIVYKNNKVKLIQNGKNIPTTSIKFECEANCIPMLTITQPIFERE